MFGGGAAQLHVRQGQGVLVGEARSVQAHMDYPKNWTDVLTEAVSARPHRCGLELSSEGAAARCSTPRLGWRGGTPSEHLSDACVQNPGERPAGASVVKSGPSRLNADVQTTATCRRVAGYALRWVTDDPPPRTVILFGARGPGLSCASRAET